MQVADNVTKSYSARRLHIDTDVGRGRGKDFVFVSEDKRSGGFHAVVEKSVRKREVQSNVDHITVQIPQTLHYMHGSRKDAK